MPLLSSTPTEVGPHCLYRSYVNLRKKISKVEIEAQAWERIGPKFRWHSVLGQASEPRSLVSQSSTFPSLSMTLHGSEHRLTHLVVYWGNIRMCLVLYIISNK